MKHTPGPWTFANGRIFSESADDMVFDLSNYGHGVADEANAQLIACAPELLHNCREALCALSVVRDHFDALGQTEMVHDLETEIGCLKLVIAKAEGN